MRLTWMALVLMATLAVVGCSEPAPSATLTPTPGATPAAVSGQITEPASSSSPPKPAPTTEAPTPAAEPAASASPGQEAPMPAPVPVAEPIPELIPVPAPTPVTTTASPLPEFVPGRSFSQEDIYNFTEVSAGYDHSCGLRSDGTILCWGNGRNGETEPPEGAFTAVSAGDGYTCGIKTDGSVGCWGIWGITFGMPVFDTSTHRRPESPTGVFKSISTGNAHACGIKADDTLECWGENRVSAGDFSREAGQATPPPGAFLSISAGGSTNCGVTTENQVVCWGAGYEGAESPVEGKFLSVSAGGRHSCGVKIDNALVCWGEDSSGQGAEPAGEFASVSVGGYQTCGVKMTGHLECWGNYLRNPAPQGEFQSVSVSGSHRCAVRSDGAVVCWGHDSWYHRLGLKTGITCGVLPNRATVCPGEEGYDLLATVHAADWVQYYEHNGSSYPCGSEEGEAVVCWDPYQDAFVGPAPIEVVEFSADVDSACWLFEDGTTGCWGVSGGPGGVFRSITAGEGLYSDFACGVRLNGDLACWGDDGHDWGNIFPPEGSYKSVGLGWGHGCAIKMDDTVDCWGLLGGGPFHETFRSLGGGAVRSHCGIRTDDALYCWGWPAALPGAFKSVSLSGLSGPDYIYCGVRTDGTVACSGTDYDGIKDSPQGEFLSVSVGGAHACGVRTDGAVACWGSDTYDGEPTGRTNAPPGQFLSVSVGRNFTCGIRTDHTLTCWGRVPDVLMNLSGIKPPPPAEPIPTPTPDIWLLPLRDQLELLKQEPGPLATNVRNLDMIYRIVGMMTEAEQGAMVEETELLLEELGPPKGKARTHTYAHIWLGLIEAFASSLDDFNNFRSISEFRLRVHFYVFLPEYLPAGFRYDGVGISGGGGWGDDASGWTIHFSRSPEWYPQMESGAYERITFNQSTNQQKGNPFRGILPRIGGGEKIVLPNLEAAGIDDVRYWLGYSEWGAGGKDQYYQVAWEDPETDSFTHVISSLSQEETFKVVGSIR